MAYSQETLHKVRDMLSARRARTAAELDARKAEAFTLSPELKDLEDRQAALGLSMARSILASSDPEKTTMEFRAQVDDIIEERRRILSVLGFSENYLELWPVCHLCSDSGYLNDGKMCICQRELLRQVEFDSINEVSPLQISNFEEFSLEYYTREKAEIGISPFDLMTKVLNYCRLYAEDFSPKSDSLLFSGRTGLGKTHLSLAIAGEVIGKGYGVLYGTAQSLISAVEREKFSGENTGTFLDSLLSCDLLVLDDLGSEFTTGFVTATLYDIINSRMNYRRPTVISTNLDADELYERYGEKICSRIFGTYRVLGFLGEDIRTRKK